MSINSLLIKLVKFRCRGAHKVFGKYKWHEIDAKNTQKAREKHWKTYPPASRTWKKYEQIVCKRVYKKKKKKG